MAKSDVKETWATFDEALRRYRSNCGKGVSGVGFQLGQKDTPYVAWDFDHCRNPENGKIDPKVWEYVDTLNSYTEVSPSGRGLRVITLGTLPEAGRKKGLIKGFKTKKSFRIFRESVRDGYNGQ